MESNNARQSFPTVSGYGARRVAAALGEKRIDAAPLLKRAGLMERDVFDPQKRLPAIAQARLFELAADATRDSAFGLRVAETANPRESGLLFYVSSAGGRVGDALTLAGRYCRIANESVRLTQTRKTEAVTVEMAFIGLPRHESRHVVEFGVATLIRGLREAAGRKIAPIRAGFAHARESNLRDFERFFGCPVQFQTPSDYLDFSEATLALPLVTADPHLLETLKPFCEAAARERGAAPESLRAAVENEVQKRLPDGKAEAQAVAKALGLSLRTFSRRLAEEGTNYAEIADQLRRSLALQYLREPNLTLSQIAWLLGYEGSTSFNHAFKRWTGRTPSAARQRSATPFDLPPT